MYARFFVNIFVVSFSLNVVINEINAYQIPDLTFEKLDDGFRVSIPQEKDVVRVAFNINRNRPFSAFEQGDFSEQVRSPVNGRFVYDVKRQLEDDDKIYAWVSVQYKDLIYRKMAEPKVVSLLKKSFGDLDTTTQRATERVNEPKEQIENNNNKPEIPTNTKTDQNSPATCEKSITKATKYNQKLEPRCRGDLIFEDDFNAVNLNAELWSTEVRLPSDTCEDEFVLYNTSNVIINNGALELKASLWNDNQPGTEIRQGLLDLGEKCTELSRTLCRRQPAGPTILPPVISGRINTKSSFSFQYGRVIVRAKFPAGDWLYPMLLLEPKVILLSDPQPCFHTRIAFSRGNRYLTNIANTEDIGSQRLSGGVVFTSNSKDRDQFMVNKTSWESFSNEFHDYELIWNENYLTFKVDGAEYGRIRIDDMNSAGLKNGPNLRVNSGPLNRQFALTLGLAAGGHADFPERGYRKPWVNTGPKAALSFWNDRENWFNTWNDPSLKIDYVRVYAL